MRFIPSIFLAVLLACLLPQTASAYYNPGTGRFIGRDPIAERDGPNHFAFVRNDPVGEVDPVGLWRYRSDMGEFEGKFGTHLYANPGTAGKSSMELVFRTYKEEFDAMPCATCTEIRFVQLYYTSKHGFVSLGLELDKWTLDSGDPFYPVGEDGNPGIPQRSIFASMNDNPGFFLDDMWIARGSRGFVQKFETCAVCSDKSLSRGDVYGCVTWQHSWNAAPATVVTRPSGWYWERQFESVSWKNTGASVAVTDTRNPRNWKSLPTTTTQQLGGATLAPGGSDTYTFWNKAGKRPSSNMTVELRRYFGSGF